MPSWWKTAQAVAEEGPGGLLPPKVGTTYQDGVPTETPEELIDPQSEDPFAGAQLQLRELGPCATMGARTVSVHHCKALIGVCASVHRLMSLYLSNAVISVCAPLCAVSCSTPMPT